MSLRPVWATQKDSISEKQNNKTKLEIRGWNHECTLAEDLSSTPGIHFTRGSDVATACLFLTGLGGLSLHVLHVLEIAQLLLQLAAWAQNLLLEFSGPESDVMVKKIISLISCSTLLNQKIVKIGFG